MRLRQITWIAGAMLLSLGLSGILLAPAAQLTLLSVAKYRTDWLDGGGFPTKYLITLLLPPNRQAICDLLYCGVSGLALALFASLRFWPLRKALPILWLTVLSAAWMLGAATPFGKLVWVVTPNLLKGSLYPQYAMAAFCLGIALLAGIGLDQVPRLGWRWKYGAVLIVAGDLIVANFGRPMNQADIRQEAGITRQQMDGSAEKLMRLRQLTHDTPPARIDSHQYSAAYTRTAPLTLIPTASGYNPLALERVMQTRLAFARGERWGAWYEVENIASPMIDALSIRYLLSGAPVSTAKYAPTAVDGVFENRTALPRFWMVHRVHWVNTPQAAFDAIHQADFAPAEEAVAEGSVQTFNSSLQDSVSILRYEPRDVTVSVKTTAPGLLASSEANYPGWQASLDGKPAAILYTNAAFRGVIVPAGEHLARFHFAPRIALASGILISAFSALIAALLFRGLGSRRYRIDESPAGAPRA